MFNEISIPKLKLQIKGQVLNFWHANDSNAKMSTCFDHELLSDKHRVRLSAGGGGGGGWVFVGAGHFPFVAGSAPKDRLIKFTVLL